MFPNTLLTLANKASGKSFAFARYEIPEHINFGGEQRIVSHEMVGGAKTVDVMGQQNDPIEWSGNFVGSQAVDRAKYVDGMRKDGKKWTLIWNQFRFEVVIKSFRADFHQFYRVSYRIVFEVIQDLTRPVLSKPLPSLDQLISSDFGLAGILGADLNDESISTALIAANAALAVVGTLRTAGPSGITSVLLPISIAQNQVNNLLGSSNANIKSINAASPKSPGTAAATQAASINSQISAVTKTSSLLSLGSVLGRVQNNLGTIAK